MTARRLLDRLDVPGTTDRLRSVQLRPSTIILLGYHQLTYAAVDRRPTLHSTGCPAVSQEGINNRRERFCRVLSEF